MKIEQLNKQLKSPFFWLMLLIVLDLIFYARLSTVFFGYDDFDYVSISNKILTGTQNELITSNSGHRFLYNWLNVIWLFLFSKKEFFWALTSLFSTIGTLLLLYKFVRKVVDDFTAILVMFFFNFNYYTFFFSTKVYPDTLLCFLGFLSFYWLWFRKNPLLITLVLFCGLLTKMLIVFIGPVFIYFLILDVKNKENLLFWKRFFTSFGVLLGIYLFTYYHYTGDILGRFTTFNETRYLTKCSYDVMPINALINRLTIDIPMMFYGSGMILLVGFLFVKLSSRQAKMIRLIAVIVLSTYWFMTISPNSYLPLCTIEVRHFLMLVPFLALVAGVGLNELNERKSYVVSGLFFLLFVLGIRGELVVVFQLFTLFLLVFFICRIKNKVVVILLLFSVLSIHAFGTFVKKTELDYSVKGKLEQLKAELK